MLVRDTGEWDESEGLIKIRLGIVKEQQKANPATLLYVSEVLDDSLTSFAATEEVVFQVPCLAGDPTQISTAIYEYIATQLQDRWMDELLERGFDVELTLGELADSLRA